MSDRMIALLSHAPFAMVGATTEWARLLLTHGLGVPAFVYRGACAVAWLNRPPLHAPGVVVEVFLKLVGIAKGCFCALYHLALVVGVPYSMRFVEYQRPARGAAVSPRVHGGCCCVCCAWVRAASGIGSVPGCAFDVQLPLSAFQHSRVFRGKFFLVRVPIALEAHELVPTPYFPLAVVRFSGCGGRHAVHRVHEVFELASLAEPFLGHLVVWRF